MRQISFIMNGGRTSFVIVFLIKQLFLDISTTAWETDERRLRRSYRRDVKT